MKYHIIFRFPDLPALPAALSLIGFEKGNELRLRTLGSGADGGERGREGSHGGRGVAAAVSLLLHDHARRTRTSSWRRLAWLGLMLHAPLALVVSCLLPT